MTVLSKRPTIKDVARVAGVTYPTVSRVLSGKPYVSGKTKTRVMQAIEELGYKPSAAARSMVSQRTHTLAMLVPHLTDPNFGMWFSGAEREARRQGYSMLVVDHEAVAQNESGLLTEHRVDGFLVIEPYRFDNLGGVLGGMPITVLDDVPSRQKEAGTMVGEHLRALGHSKVVMVGGHRDAPHAKERFFGLQNIFKNAQWLPGDWQADSGFALLEDALHLKPSAIFAANDMVALGVLNGLQQRGLRVPQDVSVVGFDDAPLSKHTHPPLTTIRQPFETQGGLAVRLLIAKLRNEVVKANEQLLQFELVKRDSTAAAAVAVVSARSKRKHQ